MPTPDRLSPPGLPLLLLAIFSAACWEGRDSYDPQSGRRICRAPPAALAAWSFTHRERRPEDRRVLDRWAREHPEDLDRRYGASCSTALHIAARFGRDDLAALLIERGTPVAVRDEDGRTPLHVAARAGDGRVAALMLERGADPNARDDHARTPLHDAAQGPGTGAGMAGRVSVARLLLSRGADVDAIDRSRWTPLRHALGTGGPTTYGQTNPTTSGRPMVEALLGAKPDLGIPDAQGTTYLHQAAATGDTAVVRLLLERGADVGVTDRFSTALGSAASNGRVEVVELLLGKGAEIDRRVAGSPLPFGGLPPALALLHPSGSGGEAALRRRQVVKVLLDHGADLGARDAAGVTLLHHAAGAGDTRTVELLLAHGADATAADSAGVTPLHAAVEQGHVDTVKLLLAAHADPGAPARDGRRPFDLAAGDPELEALLGLP